MKKLRLINFITTLFTALLLCGSVHYVEKIPEIRTPIFIYSVLLIITNIIELALIIKFKGLSFPLMYFLNIVLSFIMQRYILNMYINNNSVYRFNISTDSLPLIILTAHCIITMLLGVLNYVATLFASRK